MSADRSAVAAQVAVPAIIVVTGLLSAAVVIRGTGSIGVATGFVAAAILLGAAVYAIRTRSARPGAAPPRLADWSVTRTALAADPDAVALTDRDGRLLCVNDAFEKRFGVGAGPDVLALGDGGEATLAALARAAWRDGQADARIDGGDGPVRVDIRRAGVSRDTLVWRLHTEVRVDSARGLADALNGPIGQKLGEAGVMVALIGAEGRVRAANAPFRIRACGHADAPIAGRELAGLIATDRVGRIRIAAEGQQGAPLRMIQTDWLDGSRLVALLDEEGASDERTDTSLQSLLTMLPLGLALADRDGRFLFINDAFARAARIAPGATPLFPGDLVVAEDKSVVADSVRRFANGPNVSGDIAIRLRDKPDEAVTLTLAGARGLGEAAVLLSLRDNSEESRLKREVAQATKMQAVGQLAGGLAHDFNNILTAIIGSCDLMLMRHAPGDSDYDDIHQIKLNSDRAAGLTRQLLAFSRQQTQRLAVLQLPDVVAEVAHLLKRVLSENVVLATKHGRGLGPVRADPGQLEQVIVNLVLNARDAMPGGGTVTIETFSVTPARVRAMGHKMMPEADYTALSVADTGTGIDPDILGNVFEPFFTTKEVGKGTGLGLSMVYGIVKQSGGFIFAESEVGTGTRFTIYLPVDHSPPVPAAPPKPAPRAGDLWGSASILLVEDEDIVRTVATRALERHGYRVTGAANGAEGLALIESGVDVDIIVSDVMMPEMDGPTMARTIRQRRADLPIIFMSGYAEEQARKSIDMQDVGFLAKPFAMKDLIAAVRDRLAG